MPCALTTNISIIWPNRRDKECRKSKTETMAQILYVHFVKQKEEHCEWNNTHSKGAQSQNNSLRPWQGGPCFRQPGSQLEVREAKNPPASKWLEGHVQLRGAFVLLDSPPFIEGLLLPMDRFLASCQVLFKLPKCLYSKRAGKLQCDNHLYIAAYLFSKAAALLLKFQSQRFIPLTQSTDSIGNPS